MAVANAENAGSAFNTLSMIRQFGLLLALAGSIAVGVWLVLWLKEPSYSVLFASMDSKEASLIMQQLQQDKIPYKLDNTSGALMVPSEDVYDARIKLAAQGLPKGTTGGMLGLNEDSGFGVSEAMEKIRFQKALESELAMTVASLNNVKSARIHLAIPKQSVFVRNRQKPRASVVVDLYSGRALTDGQVAAIVHLVGSSVANLEVENVTVVDQNGRLLTNGAATKEMAQTSTQFEYTQRLEKSYIERIENILAPIVGNDAIRAQVTADIDFTFSEQTQETYNPDTPTPRSVQTFEEQSSGGATTGGVPGALSNQPPGAASAPETATAETTSAASTPRRSSRRETKNYELDKTISHTRFATGRLQRLSAAVVVDDAVTTDADGKVEHRERSPEEIERITNLVKKAIGFNLQRGDSVNVINAAFTQPEIPEAIPEPPIYQQPWLWDAVKHVVGVILVLVLAFAVVRPLFRAITATIQPIVHLPQPLPAPVASGEVADDRLSLTGAEQKKLEGPSTPYERNLQTAHQAAQQDPKLVAQVVKNWVSDNG
jgi:flagellar M-ring protein FliF